MPDHYAPLAQLAEAMSSNLIKFRFESEGEYQPGKTTIENWALRRGLNYQIVQGSSQYKSGYLIYYKNAKFAKLLY